MPFFENEKNINKGEGNLTNLNPNSKKTNQRKLILNPDKLSMRQKRVSFIASKEFKSSVSVEASIAFPVFLAAVYLFITLIQIFTLQSKVEFALHETAKEMALYGYLYDEIIADTEDSNGLIDQTTSLLIGETYVKKQVIELVGESYIERSAVKNGVDGIYFYFSTIMGEEDAIDLVATYRIKPKFQLIPVIEIPIINRCKIKAFSGYDKVGEESIDQEEMVYVTKNGEVYHKSLTCSYLQMDRKVATEEIGEDLTVDGKTYRPCSYCVGENDELPGYVTLYGDCYHTSPYCSRIYRVIFEIPLSEVGERRPCSKCY